MPSATADDRLDQVARLSERLVRISGNIARANRRRPGARDLVLLDAVRQAGRARPSELAEHLGVSRARITQQVQALLDAGELRAEVDPQDRRSVLLELAQTGDDRLKELTERGLQRWALFTATWSTAEVTALADLLDKLEQSIADAVRHQPPVTGPRWRRAPTPEEPDRPEESR